MDESEEVWIKLDIKVDNMVGKVKCFVKRIILFFSC
jgi:hypothetical protein